jgi:hypothetical protein
MTRIDVFPFHARAQISEIGEGRKLLTLRVALAFRVSDLARMPVGVTITPITATKGVIVMLRQGQVFKLSGDTDESSLGRIAIGSVAAAQLAAVAMVETCRGAFAASAHG